MLRARSCLSDPLAHARPQHRDPLRPVPTSRGGRAATTKDKNQSERVSLSLSVT
jgi:hypothetical protein